MSSAPCSDRKPGQLSGGQRQRVAMGRAIVRQPQVFLFDEPLSNLDAKLRIAMRVEIRKLQRRLNTTSIYVTHDQLEAMTLADILVVMNAGQVEQVGKPLDIYHKPASTFVASFIGAPPMNLMPLSAGEIEAQVSGGSGRAPGILGVRPEDFVISADTPAGGFALDLTVEAIEPVGAETFIYGSRQQPMQGVAANPGELPAGEVIVRTPGAIAPAIGERIRGDGAARKIAPFQRRRPPADRVLNRHSGAGGSANPESRDDYPGIPGLSRRLWRPVPRALERPANPCPYWLLTGRRTRHPVSMGRRKGPGIQSRFERTL